MKSTITDLISGSMKALMLALLFVVPTQMQAKEVTSGSDMVTCSCSQDSCNMEGCGHHGHDSSYRQLMGVTRAIIVSSDALTKISADLAPRYNRTHVPARRIHSTSLNLVGTMMSQHDNCGRWKRLVDLVNHKMRELARGYSLDHSQWKNPHVEHAYNTISKDHEMFVSIFNSYFEQNECVPNSVGGEQQ